jgi:hypothetical protein
VVVWVVVAVVVVVVGLGEERRGRVGEEGGEKNTRKI